MEKIIQGKGRRMASALFFEGVPKGGDFFLNDGKHGGKGAFKCGDLGWKGEKGRCVVMADGKPSPLIFAPKRVEDGGANFENARKDLRIFEMILPMSHEMRALIEFIEQRVLVFF